MSTDHSTAYFLERRHEGLARILDFNARVGRVLGMFPNAKIPEAYEKGDDLMDEGIYFVTPDLLTADSFEFKSRGWQLHVSLYSTFEGLKVYRELSAGCDYVVVALCVHQPPHEYRLNPKAFTQAAGILVPGAFPDFKACFDANLAGQRQGPDL